MGVFEDAAAELARRSQPSQDPFSAAAEELRRRRVMAQPTPQSPVGGPTPDYTRGMAELSALSRPQMQERPIGTQEREARGEGVVPFMQPPPENPEGREYVESELPERLNRIGEDTATLLNIAGEAMTLGVVGDEASARFDQMLGRGSYEDRLQARREQEADFRERNPGASIGAELAGGAVGAAVAPASLGRWVASGAGRIAQSLRAGALSGVAGAIYGFNEGEGTAEDRLAQAARTGGLSAAFGFVAPSLLDGIASIPRGVQRLWTRANQRPSVQTLRDLKNAAYQAVERAGVRFSGDDMTALSQRVRAAFDADNYVDDVDTASRATLRLLERREGQETTLGQLDRIRRNLWDRYAGARDQPRILDAIAAIDDLVGQAAEGSDLMAVARAANARFAKTQLLEDAFRRVQDQTATAGSGGNIVNNYRRAVSNIINNRRTARFFSPEEIEVMRGFVRGSTGENLQRLVGKLSPTGNGLMMALHIVGGMASSGMTLPLMGVGAGAKAMADRGVMRGAEGLMRMTSGAVQPGAALAAPISNPALAGGVVGGVVAGNEVPRRLGNMIQRTQ